MAEAAPDASPVAAPDGGQERAEEESEEEKEEMEKDPEAITVSDANGVLAILPRVRDTDQVTESAFSIDKAKMSHFGMLLDSTDWEKFADLQKAAEERQRPTSRIDDDTGTCVEEIYSTIRGDPGVREILTSPITADNIAHADPTSQLCRKFQ